MGPSVFLRKPELYTSNHVRRRDTLHGIYDTSVLLLIAWMVTVLVEVFTSRHKADRIVLSRYVKAPFPTLGEEVEKGPAATRINYDRMDVLGSAPSNGPWSHSLMSVGFVCISAL